MASILTVYINLIFIDYLMMSRSDGFSLVELLMSIVVLSALATIGIDQFSDFSKDAKTAVTNDKLMALKSAIVGDTHFFSGGEYTKQGFQSHCGAPPTSLTNLITMPGAGTCSVIYNAFTKIGWRGPYVSNTDTSWNKDGWGTTIEYFVLGPPVRTIRSCGPDKICGNTDDLTVTY